MGNMKLLEARTKKIEKIKEDIFLLSFACKDIAATASPGQFLHIKVNNETILRRPISIHSIKGEDVYILFRVRGKGTEALSCYKPGDTLDILGPLGKGFNIEPITGSTCRKACPSKKLSRSTGCKGVASGPRKNILIAGGMGAAPLVFLAEKLKEIPNPESQITNYVILGAKTKNEILCEKEFKKLRFKVLVATEDGSYGTKGTVIDVLDPLLQSVSYLQSTSLYACGPNAMFLKLSEIAAKYPGIKAQVSFEQFMGCGIGICCGCSINTKNGYKKACKDGPVFDIKDIW